MTRNDIYTIISRYLAGEATSSDLAQLNDWLAQDESNARQLEQLRKFWAEPVRTPAPRTSFEEFFARIEAREHTAKQAPRRILRLTPFAAAASVALFIAAAAFMFLLGGRLMTPVTYYTVACKSGVERLVLPDSTVVYLNEASRVTYTSDYEKKRRVRLDGEAYFDVVKGRGTFQVEVSDNTAIEVLGTKFNVTAFAEKEGVVATLEEGVIKFIGGGREFLLEPGQQVIYNRRTLECTTRQVDASIYTAWKEPVYRYASITMAELCHELERIYGVRITLNPSIGKIRISGSFKRRDDIETILNVMEKRMEFQWKRNGDHVQIE